MTSNSEDQKKTNSTHSKVWILQARQNYVHRSQITETLRITDVNTIPKHKSDKIKFSLKHANKELRKHRKMQCVKHKWVYWSRHDNPPLTGRCCHVVNDVINLAGDRRINELTNRRISPLRKAHTFCEREWLNKYKSACLTRLKDRKLQASIFIRPNKHMYR